MKLRDEGAKFRSLFKALCVSLSTRELEKKSKNATKVEDQSIEIISKIRKHSSTSLEIWESERLKQIVTPDRIYDRRVHVISSKKTIDEQRILSQDFSAISISSSQLVRLSFQNNSMSADSDAVYALIKLSITQVDFQNNSISIDSDAEYALIKMIHGQAASTDSDSDSDSDAEYALTKTAIDQADFKENSVSVDSDAKYWLTIVQKNEALCTNLSLYFRDSDAYYALISSPFIKQSKARPIALAQLIEKVDDIYVELLMLEVRCIEIDRVAWNSNISNYEWQALIVLHKQLLNEFYDFFLTTDHSSADSRLRNLVADRSMPGRMWHHEIHFFLEILRNRLSETREQMLTFIFIAYSMLALFHETISAFKDTWVECLEDLARYRMIVEENIRFREIWTKVARIWYNIAANNNSTVDRLYHLLAIVAPSHSLQQLSLYTWSLTCVAPFESARDSIMTFFNFFQSQKKSTSNRSSSIESVLIEAHETLSRDRSVVEFDAVIRSIRDVLDNYIESVTIKFKTQEVFIAVANIATLFEYETTDSSKSIFRLVFQKTGKIDFNHQQSRSTLESLILLEIESSRRIICLASRLTFITFSIILQRVDDENVFLCVHVLLLLVWSLANIEKAITIVEEDVSWRQICSFLNTLTKHEAMTSKIYADVFPEQKSDRSLSENFVVRDQMYSLWYYSRTWFEDANIDEEERLLKLSSTTASRVKRILWLEIRIASICSIFA